jgi:hypothetical protein
MRKSWTGLLGAMLAMSALAGCASNGSSSAAKSEPAAATKPSIPIPPGSPFAKVKIGMGKDEVFAKIGLPFAQNTQTTGKAWIPFHFSGSDDFRLIARYKGEGTITFSNDSAYTSGMSVISIDYDPTEPGYERQQ